MDKQQNDDPQSVWKAASQSQEFKKRRFDLPAKAPIAILMLLSLGLGFIGGVLGSNYQNDRANDTSAQRQVISSEGELISSIAKSTGESVVSVNVTSESAARDFFGFSRTVERESAGSGFIVNESGIVVTNRHVIPNGSTRVSVTLFDGTVLDGVEVIGKTNPNDPLDVAFLKINDLKGKKLVVAKLGDSTKVKVGERVIAIGNALGQFQNTVTSGIISGFGRDVVAGGSEGDDETLTNLFQTDAAINQGNSGGPLVNINGEVIGINTAVAGGQAENIGFAIPINDVKGLIATVVESGKFQKPYLGVRYISLNDERAKQLKLSVSRGAYLAPQSSGGAPTIVAGSPASKAGLKEGDVITKVNNQLIDEHSNLASVLGQQKVGDTVTLSIIRDGKDQQVQVTLESQPQQ